MREKVVGYRNKKKFWVWKVERAAEAGERKEGKRRRKSRLGESVDTRWPSLFGDPARVLLHDFAENILLKHWRYSRLD